MVYKKWFRGIALIALLLLFGASFLIVTTGDSIVSKPMEVSSFSFPNDIAYSEKTDALIIADSQNHRICLLSLKTLKTTTISGITKGIDRFGFPGGGYVDGELKNAMFNRPKGIAVAESGAIIVADTGNHAIRQIYNGKVTTIAGGKTIGYKDDKGTNASFRNPSGVAIDDDGNIFVSDTLNNVIRKIDQEGNVTTYAGKQGDSSILNEPVGLAVDEKGVLYIADGGNHQIKKAISKDKVETLAGIHFIKDKESGYWAGGFINGDAKKAYFNFPKGIALKDDGTLLISDTYNHVIRAIDNTGVYTIIGAGVAGEDFDNKFISYLDGPIGITYAKETLFIADQWNNRILLIPDKGKNLVAIDKVESQEGILTFIDNKEIIFPDVQPAIIDDEIKIPIRAVGEVWGAEVHWNQDKKLVILEKGEETIELSLEASDFIVIESRTLASPETLKEKLGLDVQWIDDYNIISIQ
ncbi:MAG: stalk domain-containing protein [Firmicutes bacterium]|nr:stalk domain-containing protein [Bacillota bacterium]